MFVPQFDHGFPRPLPGRPLVLGSAGITAALIAWAFLSLQHVGQEPDPEPGAGFDPSTVRSVAFLVPDGNYTRLVVSTPGDTAAPRAIASFEDGRESAHGAASPFADRVAVVHAGTHGAARLSVVRMSDGQVTTAPALVDLDSEIAWAADGSRVLAVRSSEPDSTGRLNSTLLSIDPVSGGTTAIAAFEGIYRVAPLGLAADGETPLAVVIHQGGSYLWAIEDGTAVERQQLSSSRIRDWRLSPDGSTLAFVEQQSGATVSAQGRAVSVSSGDTIYRADATAAQDGATWRPGDLVPGFGGPGGTLSLDQPIVFNPYLVPARWSPDGTELVARIVRPTADGETSTVTWELLRDSEQASRSSVAPREALFASSEAAFAGWVRSERP